MTAVPSHTEYTALWRPLEEHLGVLAGNEDLAAWLRATQPDTLAGLLRRGAIALQREHAHVSRATLGRLESWTAASVAMIRSHQDLWARLDDYVKNRHWHSFKAGYQSSETELGSFLGGLLGDVGALVGAFLGGVAADQRIQAEYQAAWQEYLQHVDDWANEIESRFEAEVAPGLRADQQRPARADAAADAGAVWKTAVILVVLGFAGWGIYDVARRYFAAAPPAPAQVAAAPARSARPSEQPPPWMYALLGDWVGRGGDRYVILRVGDVARAVVGGEVSFTLGRTNDPAVYEVTQHLRPTLDKGQSWSPVAFDTCERLVASADGVPLRARVEVDTLRVELTRVRLAPRQLTRKGKSIIACADFDTAPITRFELVLTRALESVE